MTEREEVVEAVAGAIEAASNDCSLDQMDLQYTKNLREIATAALAVARPMIVEECAKVADALFFESGPPTYRIAGKQIAAAIRPLSRAPTKPEPTENKSPNLVDTPQSRMP